MPAKPGSRGSHNPLDDTFSIAIGEISDVTTVNAISRKVKSVLGLYTTTGCDPD